MNVLHRLAWAALALAAGCVPTSPQPPAKVPAPAPARAPAPAPAPAAQPAPPAQPERTGWRWLPVGDLEDDDEFEGEGWGFWGF